MTLLPFLKYKVSHFLLGHLQMFLHENYGHGFFLETPECKYLGDPIIGPIFDTIRCVRRSTATAPYERWMVNVAVSDGRRALPTWQVNLID